MKNWITLALTALLSCTPLAFAQRAALPVRVVAMPAAQSAVAPSDAWMLHLPGIAGSRWVDEQLGLGFRDAGFAGALEIYDWTGDEPGIASLHDYKRNQQEARKVADYIAERVHAHPGMRVTLCGHSGGTGIAIWALEKLPDDVKIDNVILLASALSPGYDLSRALTHVRGKCFSFCSENDVLVLGTGTRMLGTIDGKKSDAAGHVGFTFPQGADAPEYDKLIQKPYDKSWMQYRNLGDHMGCMMRPFARAIVAPLIVIPNKLPVAASKTQAQKQRSN